jgi:hypothetical protein
MEEGKLIRRTFLGWWLVLPSCATRNCGRSTGYGRGKSPGESQGACIAMRPDIEREYAKHQSRTDEEVELVADARRATSRGFFRYLDRSSASTLASPPPCTDERTAERTIQKRR